MRTRRRAPAERRNRERARRIRRYRYVIKGIISGRRKVIWVYSKEDSARAAQSAREVLAALQSMRDVAPVQHEDGTVSFAGIPCRITTEEDMAP